MAINPAVGAALVSTAGGLAGSVVNQTGSSHHMRVQARLNQAAIDKQNAYNTPLNQRKRWEEAGMNPYLMASDAGNQSSAPQSSLAAPDVGTPISQAAQSVGAAVMEYPRIKSELELNKSEQAVKDAQAQGQRIENTYKATQQIADIHVKLAQIDKMVQDKRLTEYQADLLRDSYQDQLAAYKKQNTILDKTAGKIDAETELTIAKKSTEAANQLLARANAAKSDAERRQIEAIIPHLAAYYESMVYANRKDTWETVAGRVLGSIVDFVGDHPKFGNVVDRLDKFLDKILPEAGVSKAESIPLKKKIKAWFDSVFPSKPEVLDNHVDGVTGASQSSGR